MAAVIRYNNRLSSNSSAVRCSYDNSGTAPDVPVHLATMECMRGLVQIPKPRMRTISPVKLSR